MSESEFEKKIHSTVTRLESGIQEELVKIREERTRIETMKEESQIKSAGTSPIEKIHFPSKIKLDVGGAHFTTSLSTLTQVGGSLFSGMFSGNIKITPDKDGYYFIDRDPTVFPHILNFLRGTPPDIKNFSKREIGLLAQEAKYYLLDDLDEFLNRIPKFNFIWVLKGACSNKFTVAPDQTTITCINGWSSCQLGDTPIPDSGTLEVTLSWTGAHEAMFGIARATQWPFADNSYPGTGNYGVTQNDSSLVCYQSYTATDKLRTVVNSDTKEIKFYLNGVEHGSRSFGQWTDPLIFVLCLIHSTVQVKIESTA